VTACEPRSQTWPFKSGQASRKATVSDGIDGAAADRSPIHSHRFHAPATAPNRGSDPAVEKRTSFIADPPRTPARISAVGRTTRRGDRTTADGSGRSPGGCYRIDPPSSLPFDGRDRRLLSRRPRRRPYVRPSVPGTEADAVRRTAPGGSPR